jgi:hypothetical protein
MSTSPPHSHRRRSRRRGPSIALASVAIVARDVAFSSAPTMARALLLAAPSSSPRRGGGVGERRRRRLLLPVPPSRVDDCDVDDRAWDRRNIEDARRGRPREIRRRYSSRSNGLSLTTLAGHGGIVAHSHSSLMSRDAISAGMTLLLSSVSGYKIESMTGGGGGIGRVTSLFVAAFLSNASRMSSTIFSSRRPPPLPSSSWRWSSFVVPTEHYLYDACWKVALPMSLIYALLSSSSSSSSSPSPSSSSPSATAATKTADARGVAMRRTVLGMALPFVAGSIGSVLGCVSSYLCIDLSTPARN